MDNSNLLQEMSLALNQYTKTEKKIAEYVLHNADKVLFMSITELADACGVAEASVHRFCKMLKVSGYQAFKMHLSIGRATETEHGGHKESSSHTPYEEILQYHLDAIRETNEMLHKKDVDQVVEMMSNAERIVFMGVGNSMTTAEEAAGKFLHITPKAQFVADAHMQAMAASMASPADVFVFISYSGATVDNIQVASIAKKKGAKIIAITRFPKSELTKQADVVLICGSKESPLEGGSMGAKMSQLHIIDVLFQCYYQKNLKESRKNNEATAGANLNRFN